MLARVCLLLSVLLPCAALGENLASVHSTFVDAEACADEKCVVLTWQGNVSNHTLGKICGDVVLCFCREDGTTLSEVEVGSVELGRMERREISAVLEIDLATWENVHSVHAEVRRQEQLEKEKLGVTPGMLVAAPRTREETAEDVTRKIEQLRIKIRKLQRDYDDARAEYEALRIPLRYYHRDRYRIVDNDDREEIGRRRYEHESDQRERKLERLAKRMNHARQRLEEARAKLRELERRKRR
jgi:hypothetical protein